MKTTIVAKLDRSGSETLPNWHYTIGKKGDNISGGFYVSKKMEFPTDVIEIEVPNPNYKKEKEEK